MLKANTLFIANDYDGMRTLIVYSQKQSATFKFISIDYYDKDPVDLTEMDDIQSVEKILTEYLKENVYDINLLNVSENIFSEVFLATLISNYEINRTI